MTYESTNPAAGDDGVRQNQYCVADKSANNRTENRKQVLVAHLFGSDRIECDGITIAGSTPVLLLCRELIAAGVNPDQALDIFRNGILALRIRSLAEAAELEINAKNIGFVGRRIRGGRQ